MSTVPRRVAATLGIVVWFGWLLWETTDLAWVLTRRRSMSVTGDWLINYEGGFVRRGLSGDVIRAIAAVFDSDLRVIASISHVVFYAVFFGFTALLLVRQPRFWPFLLVVVSPAIFLFQVLDPQGGFRKEIMAFALLAVSCWARWALSERSRWALLVALFAVFPAVVLSHEALLVFLPALAIPHVELLRSRRRAITCLVLAGFSGVALLASMLRPGNIDQVYAICSALEGICRPNMQRNGAISFLAWTSDEARQLWLDTYWRREYIGFFARLGALTLLAFVPAWKRVCALFESWVEVWLFWLFSVQLIVLSTITQDIGRSIYWFAATLGLLALQSDPSRAQPWDFGRVPRWAPPVAGAAYLVVAAFYAVSWHVPHWMMESGSSLWSQLR